MLLQEFLDLGFKITFEQMTTNYTMVIKEDKRYVEIFNAYANHNEDLGYKLLMQYKIYCRSRTSQGTDDGNMKLCELSLYEEKMGKRIIIEREDIHLMLYVDSDTNVVDRVLDALWYFGSCSSHTDIYSRDSENDNTTAKTILKWVYHKRLNNAQHIRNYYNKEIRELKKRYKSELETAKLGLDFLKLFDGFEVE